MNYLDWEHAKVPRNVNADYLYEELDKRELPIVVMEPLLGGRLASVPERLAEMMKEREPEKSIASWAFRFCGSYPRILTVLSGMASMDPLIENVETYSHFQRPDRRGIQKLLHGLEVEHKEQVLRLLRDKQQNIESRPK